MGLGLMLNVFFYGFGGREWGMGRQGKGRGRGRGRERERERERELRGLWYGVETFLRFFMFL